MKSYKNLAFRIAVVLVILIMSFGGTSPVDAQNANECDGTDGIELYAEENYQGRCVRYTQDESDLNNQNFNDDAASIKFVGSYATDDWQVIVYENSNYGIIEEPYQETGVHSSFLNTTESGKLADFDNKTIGRDTASSLRIWPCVHGQDVKDDFFYAVVGRLVDVQREYGDSNYAITDPEFAVMLLREWIDAETTDACWNPTSTTWPSIPNQPSWSGVWANFNDAGVKTYKNQNTGVRATAATLSSYNTYNPHVSAIRDMLAQRGEFNRQEVEQALKCWSDGCNTSLSDKYEKLLDKWEWEYGRLAQIVSVASGMCVDIEGESTANFANIHQWDCDSGQIPLWVLEKVKESFWGHKPYYQIRSLISDKCLDAADWGTGNGTNIQQYDCHGGNNQLWRLDPKDGNYQLANVHTLLGINKCLDVESSQVSEPGANIQLWDCWGGENQQWILQDAAVVGSGGSSTLSWAMTIYPGETHTISVMVAEGEPSATFYTTWPGSDIITTLTTPSGRIIDRSTTAPDVTHSLGATYEIYLVTEPEAGEWTVELYGADVSPDGEYTLFEYITAADNPPPPPVLACVEGSTLVLNMGGSEPCGPRNIGNGETNEEFVVEEIGNGEYSVTAFGLTQTYNGVTDIQADGEEGDDSITLVSVTVPANLSGGEGDDTLQSGDGADTLSGGLGNDVLNGGGGDDAINGDEGDDLLNGEGGSDTISGGSGNDAIAGGPDADVLHGDEGDDEISGDAGADEMHGDGGQDTMYGGTEDDLMHGGSGDDYMEGDDGADVMHGDADNDEMHGQSGADEIYGDGGQDTMYGGPEDDLLSGGPGDDYMEGNDGADVMHGDAENDEMHGQSGADEIYGDGGQDTMYGGPDDDYMEGNQDADTMHGDEGQDDLIGGSSTAATADAGDALFGGSGQDTILGDNGTITRPGGTDTADGTIVRDITLFDLPSSDPTVSGPDEIHGGGDNDDLYGGGEDDAIYGDEGHDYAEGNVDDDMIYGGAGQDDLIGGNTDADIPDGDDTIYGGNGDNSPLDDDYDVILGDNGLIERPTSDGAWQINSFNDAVTRSIWLYGIAEITSPVNTDLYGNDLLYGEGHDDVMYGQGGDDETHGGSDHDYMEGNAGSDTMYGDAGQDDMVGGTGLINDDPPQGTDGRLDDEDWLYGESDTSEGLTDGDGADVMLGDNGLITRPLDGNGAWQIYTSNDAFIRIVTLLDVETISDAVDPAVHGGDRMWGNDNDDVMYGQGGEDEMHGGAGDDYMEGNTASDLMYGDGQDDDMLGGSGPIISNDASTAIPGRIDTSTLTRTATVGDDPAAVVPLGDTMYGGAGSDVMLGDNGLLTRPLDENGYWLVLNYSLFENTDGMVAPRHTISGTNSRIDRDVQMVDTVPGLTDGSDLMYGGPGDDDLYGQFDDSLGTTQPAIGDELFGGEGEDAMIGDLGIIDNWVILSATQTIQPQEPFIDDVVFVQGTLFRQATLQQMDVGGNDRILGGPDGDWLHGGAGQDLMNGNSGNDRLFGDDGDDVIWGGPHHDHLWGGYGDDHLDIKPRPLMEVSQGQNGNGKKITIPADPMEWFFYGEQDNFQDIDYIYGGWDQDAMQADVADEGPVPGDRLIDWVGAYNVYYLCPGLYGEFVITRDHSPHMIQFLQDLAAGDGAVDTSIQDSSGFAEVAIVFPNQAGQNSHPRHPDNPGHFTCID